MKVKRVTLTWIALVILIILMHHILLLTVENVLPFSSVFGRETAFGTTNIPDPPVPLPDGRIAYLNGTSIVVEEMTPALKHREKKLPLPDVSLKDASQYTIVADAVYWICKDNLYRSQWEGKSWGPVEELGAAVTFHATKGEDEVYLVASDDRQLRIAKWADGRMSPWSYIPIQDVTKIKTVMGANKKLLIASLAEYGSANKAFWWTEWDLATAKVVRQSRIQTFQLTGDRRVDDFQLAMGGTSVYLFYTEEETGGYGQLRVTLLRNDDPVKLQSSDTVLKGTVTGIHASGRQDDQVETVVAVNGQVHLLRFREGQKVGEERISGKLARAVHPTFVSWKEGSAGTIVWLNQVGDRTFSVEATSNDPLYRDHMNRFRLIDYIRSIAQLPPLLTGAVFAWVASLKWLVLSYVYLGAVNLLKRKLHYEKTALHCWVAVSIYLLVKWMFIDQFYSPQIMKQMPLWMMSAWSKYLLLVVIAAGGIAVSGAVQGIGKGKKQPEEYSAVRMFSNFVLFDAIVTALWYGFFIR
ncbi:hypothetical protein [Effusibacillus consociatus]|uniref:hypothetical protein n=1 Tax=Effusibacillus consociatus TaxID=1117041 RepID=UPI0036D3B01B